MTQWVPVASFGSQIEALLAKGQLDAAGIESQTRLNERGGALLGGFGIQGGPMDLFVRESAAEKAKTLLS